MSDSFVVSMQPGEESIWDAYVQGAQDASFFHLSGWKSVLEETYGHHTFYLMATDGNDVLGILPLFLIKNRFFGKHVGSPPGGICANDVITGQKLLEAAVELAEAEDADDLLLTGGTQVWDGDLITIQRHCTQRLVLPPDPEQLWKRISRHKRKNVGKARRSGLAVTMGGREHLDFFYEVLSHKLRDLGTPVFDKRLLLNIMSEFPEETHILVVTQGDQKIGALLLFVLKDIVYAQWAASYQNFQHYRPNDILFWHMLSWACEQGYSCCDMGRSQWGSGNYKFKSLWGAETQPLYYQYFMRRGADIPDFGLKVERVFTYRLALRAWQKLPIRIANIVGPYLRKNLYPL